MSKASCRGKDATVPVNIPLDPETGKKPGGKKAKSSHRVKATIVFVASKVIKTAGGTTQRRYYKKTRKWMTKGAARSVVGLKKFAKKAMSKKLVGRKKGAKKRTTKR